MTLSQIIEENLLKIVSMKMEANENEFVFMSKDGAIKYGHKNEFGQSIIYGFGGNKTTKEAVISDLRFLVESEPEY